MPIVRAQQVDIPYECMEKTFKDRLTFTYAKGYEADGTTTEELLLEAENTAKAADVVIVMAGTFLPEKTTTTTARICRCRADTANVLSGWQRSVKR